VNGRPTNVGCYRTVGRIGIGQFVIAKVALCLPSPTTLPDMIRVTALLTSIFIIGTAQADERFITLGSGMEPEDSGLFDYILPIFRALTGLTVHVVPVGTGRALTMGERGDADALLVHDPNGEAKFIGDGFGIDLRVVMHDDFVIVGPGSDPAGIRGFKNAAKAFAQIARVGVFFASRGDDGGTHRAELRLWKMAGIEPGPRDTWYRSVNGGMGRTLNIAAALNAYTLTDRATWANFSDRRGLEILITGDPALFNPYASILVNPAKWPHVKFGDARTWHEWLTSKPGIDAIASYRINGMQVFFPLGGGTTH
jgi:tungstate transport system substrate-binding protein